MSHDQIARLFPDGKTVFIPSDGVPLAGYQQAAGAYQRALAFDDYLEQAHRELMRCYARQGETGQALRHYQRLGELLAAELGARPSPETTLLYERLRRGDDV